MTLREIFETELRKHKLNWCRSCGAALGHKRGFVLHADKMTVHFDSEIATRSTLHGGLHEIGHCVNDERNLRSFQCEANAESFATKTMRCYGVTVPRKIVSRGVSYVRRKKRHGDNIKRGRE